MNKEEIPVFRWNTETKEFYVLEHKFDGVNSIEDFINYIHNLDKENKQLKDKLEFYSGLELDKTIDKTRLEYNKLQKENKQLKEVIEEVRGYILNHELVEEKDHYVLNGKELLQILDKAMENKQYS